MNSDRFLFLLNKAPRTPEEQAELDEELKRQAIEKAAKEAQPEAAQGIDAESQAIVDNIQVPEEQASPVEQPKPEAPQEEAPAQQEGPVEPQPEHVEGQQEEDVPYTLETLSKEVGEAVNFVGSHGDSVAIQEAQASLVQARYWIDRAIAGK